MKNTLIKKDEETSLKYGKKPENRTINELFDTGFIVLDKDSGPTSHQITDNLKSVLNIEKAGHSGTLDPKVTGVLLIGMGRATRLMEYMLKSDKEYVCLIYFHSPISDEELNITFKKFTGKIKQLPPIISAVKREERERTIYNLNILDKNDNNQYVLFRVSCQHGTYIRKLCSDMGESLGINAQMMELRRTKAGPFREDDNSISLDKLRNLYKLYNESVKNKTKDLELYEKELRKYIRPMEYLLKDFKKVYVRDSAVDSICHGADLAVPGVSKLDDNIEMGETVAIMTLKEELIGMGMAFMNSKNVIKKKKGAFVKTEKVFMDTLTYPRYWEFYEKEESK